jgi:hypothetical protein
MVTWIGCLALDHMQEVPPVDPCVDEANAVAASYAPRFDANNARLAGLPEGSPAWKDLRRQNQELLEQSQAEVREVYRRHGRQLPPAP